MGVGEAKENAKLLDAAIADMELITGQKAVATKAKDVYKRQLVYSPSVPRRAVMLCV